MSSVDPLDDLEGCWAGPLCHPNSFLHRLIALTLMCVLGFGSYFCYDNPGAIQNEIKASQILKFLIITELQDDPSICSYCSDRPSSCQGCNSIDI